MDEAQELAKMLRKSHADEWRPALDEFSRGNRTRAEGVLEILMSDRSPWARERALDLWWDLEAERHDFDPSRSPLLPLVRRALDDPSPYVRDQALAALEDLGTKDDFDFAVPHLGDRSWIVRCSACSAIAGLDPARSVPLLLEVLEGRHHAVVKMWAIDALRRSADPVVTERVCRSYLARSRSPIFEHECLEALMKLGCDDLLERWLASGVTPLIWPRRMREVFPRMLPEHFSDRERLKRLATAVDRVLRRLSGKERKNMLEVRRHLRKFAGGGTS